MPNCKKVIEIRTGKEIFEYCLKHNIPRELFNEPVKIIYEEYNATGIRGDKIFDNSHICKGLFCNCRKFNQPVEIPEGMSSCMRMFKGCTSFNQPVIIPKTVELMDCMFSDCTELNSKITIQDGGCLYSMVEAFTNCVNFNQEVNIPEGVKQLMKCFENCYYFNKPVKLPSTATHLNHMFKDCKNLNSKIDFELINDTSFYVADMFYNCISFNQDLTLSLKNAFSKTNVSYNNFLRACINYKAKAKFINVTPKMVKNMVEQKGYDILTGKNRTNLNISVNDGAVHFTSLDILPYLKNGDFEFDGETDTIKVLNPISDADLALIVTKSLSKEKSIYPEKENF